MTLLSRFPVPARKDAVLMAMLLPALAAADSETAYEAFHRSEGGRKFESDRAAAGGLAEKYL